MIYNFVVVLLVFLVAMSEVHYLFAEFLSSSSMPFDVISSFACRVGLAGKLVQSALR